MNKKFAALPAEKQQRILCAATEVFATNEYKRASTDDIAAKAGISKGLLFYYFHNKHALYTYVVDTMIAHTHSAVVDTEFATITDFFALLEHAAQRKIKLIAQMPYLADLAVRVYYAANEETGPGTQFRMAEQACNIYATYFKNIDFSKFKNGTDPTQILQMLTWMTGGYLHEKRSQRDELSVEALMAEFRTWAALFRKIAYKEEFQ